MKKQGVKAGVVINPATPLVMIQDILSEVDLVLLMSVNPGFGGQSFIYETVPKIEKLATWRTENNYSFEIQVDGGVNLETAKICTEGGPDLFVAGSTSFNKTYRYQV